MKARELHASIIFDVSHETSISRRLLGKSRYRGHILADCRRARHDRHQPAPAEELGAILLGPWQVIRARWYEPGLVPAHLDWPG